MFEVVEDMEDEREECEGASNIVDEEDMRDVKDEGNGDCNILDKYLLFDT